MWGSSSLFDHDNLSRESEMSPRRPRISSDDLVDAILPIAGSATAFLVLMVLLVI
jgi:hypothetical protein